MRTFTWKKAEIEGLPDIAVIPCGHDLGKFIGDGIVQCCSCEEKFEPPKPN